MRNEKSLILKDNMGNRVNIPERYYSIAKEHIKNDDSKSF